MKSVIRVSFKVKDGCYASTRNINIAYGESRDNSLLGLSGHISTSVGSHSYALKYESNELYYYLQECTNYYD